jgi:hypothetical protein
MAGNQKTVELVVRARDESQRALNSAKTALDRFTAAAARTNARRDLLSGQMEAARAAHAAYTEAAGAAEMLGRKLTAAKRPSAALRTEFDQAREAARRAKQEFLALGTGYAQMVGKTGGRGSFAAFEGGIAARAGAESAAAGVNGFARALELAAANQMRLDRISRADHFSKTASQAKDAERQVDALADALTRVADHQAQKQSAEVAAGSAGATDRERKAALGAAAAARQHALAMAAQRQAAREVAAAEEALAAVQLSVDASAEQVISAQRRVTASYAAAETAARQVTTAQQGVATAQKNLARSGGDAASRLARDWSSRQGRGFLGLRPYELQNLSYQVNDVFTQIASGTPVMQVAAQQGGQFAQLFPRAGAALLRFLPIIGLVTVALSPFISGMMKANDEAKTLSEFDKLLTRSGNAAAYTAPYLAAVAANLDDYSGSLKDARAALTEFVGDAVDPAYLQRFGKAALDLAKVMKMDVAEASKTVSDAFTGNADAILALDDQLGFLTAEERKHAEALREQKRDAELRTEAFAIFEQRYGETAAKMRGPWSQILRDFGAAWDAFAQTVNLIDLSEAEEKIDGMVKRIQRLTAMMPGAREASTENAQAYVDRAYAARNAAVQNQAEVDRNPNANATQRRFAAGLVSRRERELNRAQTALAINQLRDGSDPLFGGGTDPSDTTTRPPRPAARSPRGGTSDAERLAEQRKAFLESLQQESVARQFQLTLIDQTERQVRVMTALEQARVRAAELGLELSAEQLKTIEDEVKAQYDAERAARGRQLIEQATLELAEARGEIESEGDFVARKLREEGLAGITEQNAATGELVTTLTREGNAYADILRNIYRINEATRKRQEAEKAVSDLTSMRADLLEQIQFYEDAGQQGTADRLREQLAEVNAELTLAVENAITMWTAMGGEGADAALLKLNLLRDQLAGVGETSIVSGRQINEMLAGGGVNAVDQFFQSLGEGVNAVQALGDAFRSFAADFLRQIAQMIVKQMILNMLQGSAGGGGGTGGTIASAITSLFRHSGGMVGEGGGYRPVPLAAFAGARRFHSGGMPGLKRNEVPTVVEDTEGVFTKGQMAALAPVGKGAGSVKVVNVWDAAEAVERGVSTERGERVMMNFIGKNAGAIKAMLA